MATTGVVSLVTDVVHGRVVHSMVDGTRISTVEAPSISPPPLPPLDDEHGLGSAFAPATAVDGEAVMQARREALPGDFLSVVVGLDYEKSVIRMAVVGRRRHVIMIGPPGSAKSLILHELHKLDDSEFIDGKQASVAGLANRVVSSNPHLVLIDEIEKMPVDVQEALLVLMDGKVAGAKAGGEIGNQEFDTDFRIIAAANDRSELIAPLYDRFIPLPMPEYSTAEREKVIAKVLTDKHKLSPAEAKRIASEIAPRSTSLREAEHIAEMHRENPKLAQEMMTKLKAQKSGTPPPTERKQPQRRRRRVTAKGR